MFVGIPFLKICSENTTRQQDTFAGSVTSDERSDASTGSLTDDNVNLTDRSRNQRAPERRTQQGGGGVREISNVPSV